MTNCFHWRTETQNNVHGGPEGRHLSFGREAKFRRCCRNSSENLCGSSCCRPIGALGITRRIPSITHLRPTSGARKGVRGGETSTWSKMEKVYARAVMVYCQKSERMHRPGECQANQSLKNCSLISDQNYDHNPDFLFHFRSDGLLLELPPLFISLSSQRGNVVR